MSYRARPVARHLLLGWDNAQIARELGLQPQTVKNYVREIFNSAGMDSRTEAVEAILCSATMLTEIYTR